jgi:hypothetical protein
VEALGPEQLRAEILERTPEGKRASDEARRPVTELVTQAKVFGPVDPADCGEVVEFELIGEPEPVGFRVPLSRIAKAAGDDAFARLHEWLRKGIVEHVLWHMPAYGFVCVVPKPSGRFEATGCGIVYWYPGEWNTIADFGSRSVVAVPDGTLSEEEQFETHIYALVGEGEGPGSQAAAAGALPAVAAPAAGAPAPATVVPGHLPMAPLLAKLVSAQASAGAAEVAEWRADKRYSTAVLAGSTIHLLGNRVVVPRGATGLKEHLLRMCHDDDAHYTGADTDVRGSGLG